MGARGWASEGRTVVEIECFFCGSPVVLAGPGGAPSHVLGVCTCGQHCGGQAGKSRFGPRTPACPQGLQWRYEIFGYTPARNFQDKFVLWGGKEFPGVWELPEVNPRPREVAGLRGDEEWWLEHRLARNQSSTTSRSAFA